MAGLFCLRDKACAIYGQECERRGKSHAFVAVDEWMIFAKLFHSAAASWIKST
jgi:hypothetical protein